MGKAHALDGAGGKIDRPAGAALSRYLGFLSARSFLAEFS